MSETNGAESGSESRAAVATAAFTGMLGVILGAFGAHGLEDVLRENGREAVWDTAVFYHLIHAVVLLVLAAAMPGKRGPARCMLGGILIFSGSLYVLAVTNIGILGAITPLGGVLFLAGWFWIGLGALRSGH